MKKIVVIYSHIVGLGVIRALGKMKVPIVALHYLPSEMGYLSKYVIEYYEIANPAENESGFISDIVQLSEKLSGSLLIPTDDYTVVALSKNKELLQSHYIVGVENWNLVKKLIQKQYTYEFAEALGIPCPKTFVPESLEDLNKYCKNITYPCLIKPCEGHLFYDYFSVKMFRIENEYELLTKYSRSVKLGLKQMIQEIIPGDDSQGVNYNSYFIDGSPVAEFTARKVRIDPPFFGSPRVLISKDIPEIIEPGRLLLKKLNYNGFSCMEFKRDTRDGIYKLMEINCRPNLTGSLAVKCGINFPWIMYRHLLYGEVITTKLNYKKNVYWIDITKDVMRFVVSRKDEGYSLREYIRPYFGKKVFAILSIRDPLPFIKRCYYIVYSMFKKSISILYSKVLNKTEADTV